MTISKKAVELIWQLAVICICFGLVVSKAIPYQSQFHQGSKRNLLNYWHTRPIPQHEFDVLEYILTEDFLSADVDHPRNGVSKGELRRFYLRQNPNYEGQPWLDAYVDQAFQYDRNFSGKLDRNEIRCLVRSFFFHENCS